MHKRKSGILLHPTSLPSEYPVGDLGEKAYRFIDIISDSGFTLWQILPINPVNYVNSPYMSPSSSAFNELLIDPGELVSLGLIDRAPFLEKPVISNFTDYDRARRLKREMIRTAWERFDGDSPEYREFCRENSYLSDIGIFSHLLEEHRTDWSEWPAFSSYDNILELREKYRKEASIFMFGQYMVQNQWFRLKKYANEKGVEIIGDLPIYVDYNSFDVWSNKEIFRLSGRTGKPVEVSGVPPDYFSIDGQLWNNPVYRWFDGSKLNSRLMDWWCSRIGFLLKFVDIIRMDHFRGFSKYWAVRYGEETAKRGKWRRGPGASFFRHIFKKLGKINIIAEDLGIITRDVEKMRKEFDFPGMKILQFAFSDPRNPYLPSNYDTTNCVVYTGTHDNNTTLGWYSRDTDQGTRHFINEYHQGNINEENIAETLIYDALASTAKWAVIPVQDILSLDERHRMNIPSVAERNWAWKMEPGDLERIDKSLLRRMNICLNRLNVSEAK